MATPNENENPKQASEYIEINESGELVVKDPQLAELIQELSPEELEQIAGGKTKNKRCSSTNGNC